MKMMSMVTLMMMMVVMMNRHALHEECAGPASQSHSPGV